MAEEIEYINRTGLNKIASETKKLVSAVDAKATQNAEDITAVDAKATQNAEDIAALSETVNGFNEAPDMEEITAEEVNAMFNA